MKQAELFYLFNYYLRAYLQYLYILACVEN